MLDENPIPQNVKNTKSDFEYQIQVSEDIYDSCWDEFLGKVPGGHHVQTSIWGQVKTFLKWKTIRIKITEQGHIVAGAQLLIRSIMPFVTVAYLTKGPVFVNENRSIAEMILQYTLHISKEKHVQLLAIQPPNNGKDMTALLSEKGFKSSSLELAPTASVIIDLAQTKEQILLQMKRQTRQNIHRSEREGITVREGSESDLHTFYSLHTATSQRQGFAPYPLDYFNQMWSIFKLYGSIKLFLAEFGNESVSALLVIPFGDTVIPKILGWSGLHHDRRPNDAVFWAAIQWAKDCGYKYFDFEGIDRAGAIAMLNGYSLPESLRHSPDFFKLGFGGQIVLYPEAFDKLSDPLLNWTYHKIAPRIGGKDVFSQIIDRLRKR